MAIDEHAITTTPPVSAGRLLTLATLAAVALGVPAADLAHGTWPGRGIEAGASWAGAKSTGFREGWEKADSVRTGRLSTEIEAALSERCRAAATVRPYYNEAMFRLFRATTPKVLYGRDGWLFLSETAAGYGGETARASLAIKARILRHIVDWLGERGTRVLMVVVPNKATLYPDKLPTVRPPYHPSYDMALEELRRAGLWTLDLRPALDRSEGIPYKPNSSHWTSEGAMKSAFLIASEVKKTLGEDLPGVPVEGGFERAPPVAHRGDLVRMLGFRKNGSLERSFFQEHQLIFAIDKSTGKRLECPGTQPLVLVGSSFSNTRMLSALLSVTLGRCVENTNRLFAAPGADEGLEGGVRVGMVGLGQEILEGRPAPRLVVWEAPERHLVIPGFPENLAAFVRKVRPDLVEPDWVTAPRRE